MNQLECALLLQAIKQTHPEIANSIASIESKFVSQEQPFFCRHSARLRIMGNGLDFQTISTTLGLTPTGIRQKGEKNSPNGKPAQKDVWSYQPSVAPERPLDEHIMAIWDAVRLQIPYLRDLKQKFEVDIFCGYRSNSSTAGFNVDYRCLGLFAALEIPFGVSIIIS